MARNSNVTLINAAISDKFDVAGISIPGNQTGLSNYYMTRLSGGNENGLAVLTWPLDSLFLDRKIALIKIDVEGHEEYALAGMRKLLWAHHPVLIVETNSEDIVSRLVSLGYVPEKLKNSPNFLFRANK